MLDSRYTRDPTRGVSVIAHLGSLESRQSRALGFRV